MGIIPAAALSSATLVKLITRASVTKQYHLEPGCITWAVDRHTVQCTGCMSMVLQL